ncbi:hypothetical protein BC834DRAFT_869679 [Gloeopeniophorella convolvens]|nr:hypothetical protein BC834DRAFT_869679 [Gloeopeniophorella convolvens]
MTDAKRSRDGNDRPKKRYRSRSIDGPGVWASCVKGKEKQTVGELYDLFESLASELWPESDATSGDGHEGGGGSDDGGAAGEEEDVEKQIARELASIKRPRKEQRFANCQTNTPCVVVIACRPPVDPVQLVLAHIANVERTGVTRTRYTHRLTPVANTCVANAPEIRALAQRVLRPFLDQHPDAAFKWKIELRVRNHNTVPRQAIIDAVVACVPDAWTVSLEDAEVFVLVEVFKSICGISVVKDYCAHQKFNVMEIANSKNSELGGDGQPGEGRVADRARASAAVRAEE